RVEVLARGPGEPAEDPGLGELRVERARRLGVLPGLLAQGTGLVPRRVEASGPERDPDRGVLRLELDRAREARGRGVEPEELVLGEPAGVVSLGEVAIEVQGGLGVRDGVLALLRLRLREREESERRGEARGELHRLADRAERARDV